MTRRDFGKGRWLSQWLGVVVVAASFASPALAAGEGLLWASAPGAYAVRFWPDRAVLSTSAETAVTVALRLPQAVKWGRLNDQPLPLAKLQWVAAEQVVRVEVPAGQHTLHLAWAGTDRRPAPGQKIPVLVNGRPAGVLECDFRLDRLLASGNVNWPVGTGTLQLKLTGAVDPAAVTLERPQGTVDRWQARAGALQAARPVTVTGPASVTLQIRAYNLLSSPVSAVELASSQLASRPQRLPQMPAAGIVIEAEDFSGQGGGSVGISEGRHFQQHGGKSIMNYSGNGHWLEWRLTVPREGAYRLLARAATQEPRSLRSLTLNGQAPAGLGLIEFPGTGGWGYTADEWAALVLAGTPEAPALQLKAGTHTLRLTGESAEHLNLDYFLLVPVP